MIDSFGYSLVRSPVYLSRLRWKDWGTLQGVACRSLQGGEGQAGQGEVIP